MPEAAGVQDFSDIDQFVQDQSKSSGTFDDIDSFVAGQARGASAAKTPAEQDFENNVMAQAAATIPRPSANLPPAPAGPSNYVAQPGSDTQEAEDIRLGHLIPEGT